MRCEEYLPLVEDYFDGELDERTTRLVGQHLSDCAPCAVVYRKLEREQVLYLSYECDAQPAPDFWDNIILKAPQESIIEPANFLSGLRRRFSNALGSFGAPRFSPSLMALIVLVAIGMTAGLMRYFNSRERTNDALAMSRSAATPVILPAQSPVEITSPAKPTVVETASRTSAAIQPQPAKNITGRDGIVLAAKGNAERADRKIAKSGGAVTPDELVRQAEQKYVAAITLLSRDVRTRRSHLDAESAARFEQTLAAIDRTIADTRRAAREHPGDPVAAQYMLTAYAKKVDVLREMIGY